MEKKQVLRVALNNGKKQEKIEIAKKLIEEGKDTRYISELTGLEKKEINEL